MPGASDTRPMAPYSKRPLAPAANALPVCKFELQHLHTRNFTMKKRYLISGLIISSLLGVQTTQAQFLKKMQQKLQDKVDKKVDDVLNGSGTKNTGTSAGNGGKRVKTPYLEEVYSFTPGATVIFADNFANDVLGRMPKHWQSSGGGSVSTIAGMPGKWLALMPTTTYKLQQLLTMPGNFTVEFDLLTRSTQAKDIGSMLFGFAKDNSNREYISSAGDANSITSTTLHFWNKAIINASSDTDIYNNLDFPLENYANELIHVAIAVEGEDMRVYINKSKVLDTGMFKRSTIKYFYLSAPYKYDYTAKMYFGNLVIAKN
jgi:hypothetical protein